MGNISLASVTQPMIVKYVETSHNGIQSQTLSRYAIGYVLRGTKYIYDGDQRVCLTRGDLFYLGIGHHYTEEIPENGQPFEQIMVYYTPTELQRILMHLNITYGMDITNDHRCKECSSRSYVAMTGWSSIRNFFTNMNNYLREEPSSHDETVENIKMTELIYMIVSHEDSCLKSKILSNIDTVKENFEQIVYEHIFQNVSIEELACKTNRSLTSFKKEFRRIFAIPPHKWFIRQRLMQARLLLISTSLSVSEIGVECTFPNTSHFIKLFKKEYGMTPAAYRSRHVESAHKGDASATALTPTTKTNTAATTPVAATAGVTATTAATAGSVPEPIESSLRRAL